MVVRLVRVILCNLQKWMPLGKRRRHIPVFSTLCGMRLIFIRHSYCLASVLSVLLKFKYVINTKPSEKGRVLSVSVQLCTPLINVFYTVTRKDPLLLHTSIKMICLQCPVMWDSSEGQTQKIKLCTGYLQLAYILVHWTGPWHDVKCCVSWWAENCQHHEKRGRCGDVLRRRYS
jgi:hypothetical protein